MKRSVKIVKYVPIVMNIAIMIGCILSLCYVQSSSFMHPLFGFSVLVSIALWFLSVDFKFCAWHRILIVNIFVVSLIVFIDKNIYSFRNLTYIRILMISTVMSSFISALLFLKIKNITLKIKSLWKKIISAINQKL